MYNLYNRFGQPGTCYTNGAFQWSVDLLQRGKWHPLQAQKLQPFTPQQPSQTDQKTNQGPIFEWNQLPLSSTDISLSPPPSHLPHLQHHQQAPTQRQKINPLPPSQNLPSHLCPRCPHSMLGLSYPTPFLSLNLNTSRTNNQLRFLPPSPPKHSGTKNSTDGFLRFTLTEPQQAFGAQQYPDIMAAVANANVTRMVNFVSFRALSPTQQTDLIKKWTTPVTTKTFYRQRQIGRQRSTQSIPPRHPWHHSRRPRQSSQRHCP